jgi:hypothetical protein
MRIRTIKPEFFLHDRLADLPPLVRILFIGLWGLADRRGRLEDRPKRIKVAVLPYDDIDVDAALNQLAEGGFIVRYDNSGNKVIQVDSFEKHQRITGKEAESESEFPPPPENANGETTGKQRGNNGETPETTGREGKGIGKEGNGKGMEALTAVAPPRLNGDGPRKLKPTAEKPTDPRFVQFRDLYVQSWQNHNGSKYPFQQHDGVQLAKLLKAAPDLQEKDFQECFEWCWQVSAMDRFADGCVRQAGTLAGLCGTWAKIVSYASSYQPPVIR